MQTRAGWFEALALVAFGAVATLVFSGQLDPGALILLLVLVIFAWMARGAIVQARRFRPVEPPRTWAITLWANLALMALGIAAFGWYLMGGGARAWVPFLFFIAGVIALRWWRRGVVRELYSWRTPALTLLQQGEYRKLARALEDEATAGRGHPDKLAMVALAYIELNKWDRADALLRQARAVAPDFASVNGALGSLRRHQARYAEAAEALERALRFEDSASSRYYLGLSRYLAGQPDAARPALESALADPTLLRQGQVYGAFVLGQIAESAGDSAAARRWYAQMAEGAPKVIPALEEEARRHKQTPYAETLKEHVRAMQRIIARRPLEADPSDHPPSDH
jgi:Tfp pilus assembly protein PilF